MKMRSHVTLVAFFLLFSTSIGEVNNDMFHSGSGFEEEDNITNATTTLPPAVYEVYHDVVYGNLSCEYYQSGGLCEYVIPSFLPVVTNYSRGPQIEFKDDLDKIFYVLSTFGSSKECFAKAVQILCHFTFPYCDPAYKEVIYQPICKWDCQIMRDFICPEEWIQMMRLQSVIEFGTIDSFDCELLSPANGGNTPMCISTFDGGPIPYSLLSGNDCYAGNGRGYTGNVSVTVSGYTCQAWTQQYPHRHHLFVQQYPEFSGNHNYCRNPGGKGQMPWCFTTNRTKRWEYCDIEECSPDGVCERYNGSSCSLYGSIGLDYVFINKTFGVQSDYEYQIDKLKGTLENFQDCREAMIQLACHVNFPTCDFSSPTPRPRKVCRSYCNMIKEQCMDFYEHLNNFLSVTGIAPLIIPQCIDSDSDLSTAGDNPECIMPITPLTATDTTQSCYDVSNNGTSYNGTINVTVSGILCQSWDSQFPHVHSITSLFRRYLEGHNYCRNPEGRGQKPWCYTINETQRWEYCDIKECTNLLPLTIIASGAGGGVAVLLIAILMLVCCVVCVSRRRSRLRQVTLSKDDKEDIIILKTINNNYSNKPIIDDDELEEYLNGTTLSYIKRNQLTYLCDLGEGHFGKVLKAEATNITVDEEKSVVAVKVLKEGTSHSARKEFFREACLMNGYRHDNIVKLLGVCIKEEPLCMVFEYMEMGDLHTFLRQNAPSHTFSFPQSGPTTLPNGLSIDQMVYMSTDIAAGLDYLTTHHYIHRDLATRNCLVNSKLCVKISDFGMSQDIYVSDYFRLGDSEMLPIRWMPPEAIMYSTFSTESDVWSFGIVLWEIFSYAMQPYYGMSNEQVVQYVKDCKVMKRPEHCPQEIYDLMLDCWIIDPKERPKASEIHEGLKRWTPELSAQVKNDIKQDEPEYQNMSVILQWAAEQSGYLNPTTLLKDDSQNYHNLKSGQNGQDEPYDKLLPQQQDD